MRSEVSYEASEVRRTRRENVPWLTLLSLLCGCLATMVFAADCYCYARFICEETSWLRIFLNLLLVLLAGGALLTGVVDVLTSLDKNRQCRLPVKWKVLLLAVVGFLLIQVSLIMFHAAAKERAESAAGITWRQLPARRA